MTALLPALSLSNKLLDVGALAAFAALLGIAVLSLLIFSQARELKRLREWAGRAPERAAELEQRVSVAAATRAQRVVQPVPRTTPMVARAVAAQPPAPASQPTTAQPAATPLPGQPAFVPTVQSPTPTATGPDDPAQPAAAAGVVQPAEDRKPAEGADPDEAPQAGSGAAAEEDAPQPVPTAAAQAGASQPAAATAAAQDVPQSAVVSAAQEDALQPVSSSAASEGAPQSGSTPIAGEGVPQPVPTAAQADASQPPAVGVGSAPGEPAAERAVPSGIAPATAAAAGAAAATAAVATRAVGSPPRAPAPPTTAKPTATGATASRPPLPPRPQTPSRPSSPVGSQRPAGARAGRAAGDRAQGGVGYQFLREEERSPRKATALIVGGVVVGVAVLAVVLLSLGGSSPKSQTTGNVARTNSPGGHGHGSAGHGRGGAAAVASPAETHVVVLNATEATGLAHHLAGNLQQSGYSQATALSATPPSGRSTSVVEYASGHRTEAQHVGQTLGISEVAPLEGAIASLVGGASVVVIAGADQAALVGGANEASSGEAQASGETPAGGEAASGTGQ